MAPKIEPEIHFRYDFSVRGSHVWLEMRVGRRGWQSVHALAGEFKVRLDEFSDFVVAQGWSMNRGETDFVDKDTTTRFTDASRLAYRYRLVGRKAMVR